MPATRSQKARLNLYASARFREELGDDLNRPRVIIDACLDALASGGIVPAPEARNSAALAADGAAILLAIGTQQLEASSILRFTRRLGDMSFFAAIGRPDPAGPADIMGDLPTRSFQSGVAALLTNLWSASRGASAAGFRPTDVSVLWGDQDGALLFGRITQFTTGRQLLWSSAVAAPILDGSYDFVHLPPVAGGTEFSALSFLGLAKSLDHGVAGTTAALDRRTKV